MSEQNNIGVHYSTITYFERMLKCLPGVQEVKRTRDVLFVLDFGEFHALKILLCNEYVLSSSGIESFIHEFGQFDMICVGGNWNSWSQEALEFARSRGIKLGKFNNIRSLLEKYIRSLLGK